MKINELPNFFGELINFGCIDEKDITVANDGFCVINKSISDILEEKCIVDVPDTDGETLLCNRFFDDWYIYAVRCEEGHVYSLLKLREQEYDQSEDIPADGDTPGVTVCFISFITDILLKCLKEPTDENKSGINVEINRVVSYRGQRHHKILKKYFKDPASEGAYVALALYVKHIASFAKDGYVDTPEKYKELFKQRATCKNKQKLVRIPNFIDTLNTESITVCDHEKIYIRDKNDLNEKECLAILATHTGNISPHSFAAEVQYHAKYLLPFLKMKIPYYGKSVYESAIRADMTIDDTEFEGPAPFYRLDSRIVKKQKNLHQNGFKYLNFNNQGEI